MKGFDLHLASILKKNPDLARDYAALIAKLPLTTQLAIMRRRIGLTQAGTSRRMKKPQSVVARMENAISDPRLSTLEEAAKALGCHLLLVPDDRLEETAGFACSIGVSRE